MKSLKSMIRKSRMDASKPSIACGTPIYMPTETKTRLKTYCAVNNLSMCRVVAALVDDFLASSARKSQEVPQ